MYRYTFILCTERILTRIAINACGTKNGSRTNSSSLVAKVTKKHGQQAIAQRPERKLNVTHKLNRCCQGTVLLTFQTLLTKELHVFIYMYCYYYYYWKEYSTQKMFYNVCSCLNYHT